MCKVKYVVPISNGKKIVQLIRLGGKKYNTVITVTQMCKKSKGVPCTPKHIVDKMWKQWHIKGGKGKDKEEDEEETTLAKVDDKAKEKAKGSGKAKDGKARRKRLEHVTIVESRDTSKKSVGRKIIQFYIFE